MAGSWCTQVEYDGFKEKLVAQAKGKPVCAYCKGPIDLRISATSSQGFTIDHMKPRSMYPELSKNFSNMLAAHKSCNSSKGTQTMEKTLADIAARRRGSRPEWDPR